jgi:hypothetical protein
MYEIDLFSVLPVLAGAPRVARDAVRVCSEGMHSLGLADGHLAARAAGR